MDFQSSPRKLHKGKQLCIGNPRRNLNQLKQTGPKDIIYMSLDFASGTLAFFEFPPEVPPLLFFVQSRGDGGDGRLGLRQGAALGF